MRNLKTINFDDFRQEMLDTTTNPKVYRYLRIPVITSCSYCSPNKGCNRRAKRNELRNWKQYRNTQYKN